MCANHVKPTLVHSFQKLSGRIRNNWFTVGSPNPSTITMCLQLLFKVFKTCQTASKVVYVQLWAPAWTISWCFCNLCSKNSKAIGMYRKWLIYSWERLLEHDHVCAHVKPTCVQSFEKLSGRIENDWIIVYSSTIKMFLQFLIKTSKSCRDVSKVFHLQLEAPTWV